MTFETGESNIRPDFITSFSLRSSPGSSDSELSQVWLCLSQQQRWVSVLEDNQQLFFCVLFLCLFVCYVFCVCLFVTSFAFVCLLCLLWRIGDWVCWKTSTPRSSCFFVCYHICLFYICLSVLYSPAAVTQWVCWKTTRSSCRRSRSCFCLPPLPCPPTYLPSLNQTLLSELNLSRRQEVQFAWTGNTEWIVWPLFNPAGGRGGGGEVGGGGVDRLYRYLDEATSTAAVSQ